MILTPTRTLLTAVEAAALVAKTPKAFAQWAWRRGLTPDGQAGRRRLYDAAAVLRVLRRDQRPWER